MEGSQPLVTVSLSGYRYRTLILSLFGFSEITLPPLSVSRIKGM
jgi:hypothetical protein